MIYTINNVQKALSVFNMAYLVHFQPGETKKSFYCGITNDLDTRRKQHNVEKFLTTIECDSFDTSSAVEKALEEEGFNVGGSAGHGKEDSVFVYMYKITGSTIE